MAVVLLRRHLTSCSGDDGKIGLSRFSATTKASVKYLLLAPVQREKSNKSLYKRLCDVVQGLSRFSTTTKANGAESSENEAESSMTEGVSRMVERNERHKRSAVGDPAPINMAPRHCRSLSMDSFMGRLNFGEELPKQLPSPGAKPSQHSHSGSMDGVSNTFTWSSVIGSLVVLR